jgi:hypothetical protein
MKKGWSKKMKGKSKKVIAVSFVAIMVMMAFLGVVSAVTIEHHTMCKGTEDSIVTLHSSTGHASSPVNETTEFNDEEQFTETFTISDSIPESGAPTSGRWIGNTSQGKDISFIVGDTQVYNFTISYDFSCTGSSGYGTIKNNIPIDIVGNAFQDEYHLSDDSRMIYGEFTTSNSATGTFRKTWTEHYPYEDTCDSGNITWGARRVQTTGEIGINEIMYNPPGAEDTDHEWLELYNNDTTDIDITGWRFYEAGINHSLTLVQGSMNIPSGGYAIIADNATTFLDEHQECNCTVIDSAFSLNNSGEYIALKNATLGIIDEVAYNTSWGADGNGRTLELNATGGWKESRLDGGTPCQQNSVLAATIIDTTAVIIDTDGNAYNVGDLEAKYTAGGMWLGSRPTRIKKSLSIVLYTTKDRITTTEDLKVPFASMRRLVFEGGSVPEELNEVFEGQKPIRIEMRDGSVILLSSTLLVEMVDRFRFEAGETQGQKITLDGFSGRAKTESGKEGDFWISLSETRSIKFEWP